MDIIAGKRGSGKTSEAICRSNETGSYIACRNRKEVLRVSNAAREMDLPIPFPITYRELLEHRGNTRRTVIIDDVEAFVRYASAPIAIDAVTVNTEQLVWLED